MKNKLAYCTFNTEPNRNRIITSGQDIHNQTAQKKRRKTT